VVKVTSGSRTIREVSVTRPDFQLEIFEALRPLFEHVCFYYNYHGSAPEEDIVVSQESLVSALKNITPMAVLYRHDRSFTDSSGASYWFAHITLNHVFLNANMHVGFEIRLPTKFTLEDLIEYLSVARNAFLDMMN
jgi:hypothetical protein